MILVCCIVFGANPVLAKSFNLVASIKPLQLIAQAVVADSDRVLALLPPGMTMHHYSLKPSDLQKLEVADMMFWLGPEHEPQLAKVANVKGFVAVAVADSDIDSEQMRKDAHVWMNGANALEIATLLVAKLQQLMPEQAEIYQANLEKFAVELGVLEQQITEALNDSAANYLVYHDAYGYFERGYGIGNVGVISSHHEIKPGARQLLKLRLVIHEHNVGCILAMPDSNAGVLRVLAEGNELDIKILDPMAGEVPPGRTGYLTFLARAADTMKACAD